MGPPFYWCVESRGVVNIERANSSNAVVKDLRSSRDDMVGRRVVLYLGYKIQSRIFNTVQATNNIFSGTL